MADQVLENDMIVRFHSHEYWIPKGAIVRKVGDHTFFLPPEKKGGKKEGLAIDVHDTIITEDHVNG